MDTKQVIIVRKDLGMRKGKMIAQGAHASLGAVFSKSSVKHFGRDKAYKVIPMEEHLEHWFNERFTKICVSCNSEEEILELTKQAKDAGLIHFLCQDAGITEFDGVPTYTALAIGPGNVEEINKITGDLKLL